MNCIEGVFQRVTLSQLNWIGLIPWYHDFFLKLTQAMFMLYTQGDRGEFSLIVLERRKSLMDCNLAFDKPQVFTFRAD